MVEAITAGTLTSVPGMATHATGPGAKHDDDDAEPSADAAESGGAAASTDPADTTDTHGDRADGETTP